MLVILVLLNDFFVSIVGWYVYYGGMFFIFTLLYSSWWAFFLRVFCVCTYLGMTEAIYQKNIYISFVIDFMLRVYKDPRFNIRSPQMKTLDQSDETLGRD